MANEATISRDQFKRLSVKLLSEAPSILATRDASDPKMDERSALLRTLHLRLAEKLGLPAKMKPPKTDFPTYEFAYRSALYELLLERAKVPFQYQPIVNEFLSQALKK
ncbi:MAG: hypothetical protein M3Q91_18760 [Acidobacteriota bacterium]|nr:hypothetical protein [Acidobacteriota bacterium]